MHRARVLFLRILLSFLSLLIDSINTNEMNGEMQFFLPPEEREIIHLSLTLHTQTNPFSGVLICDAPERTVHLRSRHPHCTECISYSAQSEGSQPTERDSSKRIHDTRGVTGDEQHTCSTDYISTPCIHTDRITHTRKYQHKHSHRKIQHPHYQRCSTKIEQTNRIKIADKTYDEDDNENEEDVLSGVLAHSASTVPAIPILLIQAPPKTSTLPVAQLQRPKPNVHDRRSRHCSCLAHILRSPHPLQPLPFSAVHPLLHRDALLECAQY